MTDPQLEILCVPALKDNYIWLLHDPASAETVVIDPGEAAPALAAADARGWTITQIWNTHWHGDHTAGNVEIRAATGAAIAGPAAEAERIGSLDRTVAEGDAVRIGDVCGVIYETPAHTAGHIAIHLPDARAIFVGDTLFAMGCGRLFEGTAEQMFAAMQRFAALDPDTRVYSGHEYTQSNGRFAAHIDPDNAAIAKRMVEVDALRAKGEPTLPTTIGQERATNPFMRASDAAALARLRAAKDAF